jgi:hypothetical protein
MNEKTINKSVKMVIETTIYAGLPPAEEYILIGERKAIVGVNGEWVVETEYQKYLDKKFKELAEENGEDR